MDTLDHFRNVMMESFPALFEGEISFTDQVPGKGVYQSRGVAVIVGITGSRKGRVLLDLELSTAQKLGKVLAPDLDDEDFPLYAAAELCNIVAGGVTTILNNENRGLGLRLSPPSMFAGIQPSIYSPYLQVHVLSFDTAYGVLHLNVGLKGE